jgi:glutamine synthetase
MGFELLVGSEVEFTLLSSTNPIVPVNDQGWSLSSALYSGSPAITVMDEIAEAMEISGLELQMYHSEGGMGQVSQSVCLRTIVSH